MHDGRTIENYVPSDMLDEAIAALYPKKKYNGITNDRYVCPLGDTFEDTVTKPDKISVARYVTDRGFEISGELSKRVESLADRIVGWGKLR